MNTPRETKFQDDLQSQLDRASRRLRESRESAGFQQKDFAQLLGLDLTTYNRYETGKIKTIPQNILMTVCEKFDLNLKWLMGFEDAEKHMIPEKDSLNVKRIPILGTIAAGLPILAQENIEDYEYVSKASNADFCLRIKGDSMINARILDGDLVYIRQQADVENGEIAAVLVDGENATLKRIYKINGTVVLRAENPNYPDKIFAKKDMREIAIIGKAVQFKSEVK